MSKTIWCLFSVDNNYDQPQNNLVRFWFERPSIEELAKHFNYTLSNCADATVMAFVNIWRGLDSRIPTDMTTYRIQEVEEGREL